MTNITDKIMIVLFVVIAVGIVLFLVKDELVKLSKSRRKDDRDQKRDEKIEEKKRKDAKKKGLGSLFDDALKTQYSRGPEIEIIVKETGEIINHTMTEKEISIGGRNAKNVTIKIDSPFISHKHLVIKNLIDEDGPFVRVLNCSKHSLTEHKVMVGGKKRWVYVRPNESIDVDEGEELFWIGDAARVSITVPKYAHQGFDEMTRVAGDKYDAEDVHSREEYCARDDVALTAESDGENAVGTFERTRVRTSFKEERDFPELNPENDPFDYL